ncbi:MAG: hypothetical protein R3234_07240 [Thermoanaerobaculia bacterium]|nr:hypothetical protein [Thermoanaerobaculia bacterium]
MRMIEQETMQQVFAVTDELGLDREEIEVPLAMQGHGSVERLDSGKLRITLPDTDDPTSFLESLPETIEALDEDVGGASPGPG